MTTCTIPWRPSGGRGEFEYVPSDSLTDRDIQIYFEGLDLVMPAEVRGVNAPRQGKPRLRKFDANSRAKLHLPQLVMAVARLPVPAREDKGLEVAFPLENKAFVMNAMDFDVIEDDGLVATIQPLRVSILHTDFQIDLTDRFAAIGRDFAMIEAIRVEHPKLALAIAAHRDAVMAGINSSEIRRAADAVINEQKILFGSTNVGSATEVQKYDKFPETDLEADVTGKEGRLLVRMHAYRERDRTLAERAKKLFKANHGGKLFCEVCSLDPLVLYGASGERAIEAHHKVPIAQLQPDSITRADDLAMVCASCHRIVHSAVPCLELNQVLALKAA